MPVGRGRDLFGMRAYRLGLAERTAVGAECLLNAVVRSVHDITTFPKVAAGSTELGLSGFDERNVPIE